MFNVVFLLFIPYFEHFSKLLDFDSIYCQAQLHLQLSLQLELSLALTRTKVESDRLGHLRYLMGNRSRSFLGGCLGGGYVYAVN